ncbi:MAG TPA: hypothetical protein VFA16_22890 [Mycobacterium sp.]|uniref:hypothetical protein n=1 Tax=Mycobacterium sp. TaxID=1785 RepID=UPI002D75B275|nr:hypothetical protein [Mycobacterium sp.]HZU50071.1 hypothetical protein [Mycobacterium sp.]
MQTTNPSVPLPPGAVSYDGGEWLDSDAGPYRCVFGAVRGPVETHLGDKVTVQTAAVQLPGGTVDDGSRIQCPVVDISQNNTDTILGLTAAQARQLARLLIAAADEIEWWAASAG